MLTLPPPSCERRSPTPAPVTESARSSGRLIFSMWPSTISRPWRASWTLERFVSYCSCSSPNSCFCSCSCSRPNSCFCSCSGYSPNSCFFSSSCSSPNSCSCPCYSPNSFSCSSPNSCSSSFFCSSPNSCSCSCSSLYSCFWLC